MTPDPATLRIVVANWRDARHPAAGGAEIYAERLAAELTAAGHHVTFLSASVPAGDSLVDGPGDGVRHCYGGGRWTVYPWVAGWLLRHRSDVDVVVDCQNGIPFFAPLWVRRDTAVVCVVHHVHTEQFGLHFPRVVAAVGRLLEGPVASRVYGNRPAVAVSPSTARALRERLRWRGPIHVVPNGAPSLGAGDGERRRSPLPSVVSVGRLVVHKRVHLLVEATSRLAPEVPGLQVYLIGTGPQLDELRAHVHRLGCDRVVSLPGHLVDADMQSALDRAWLAVATTRGEGWGLSVLEAAAAGVPTVAFDVDGLRDSVRPGRTGWLLPEGADVAAGIRRALDTLSEPTVADEMARSCRAWAAEFSWSGSAARVAAVIATEVSARRRPTSRHRERRHVVDGSWVVELSGVQEGQLATAAAGFRRTDRSGVWHGRAWLLFSGCGSADVDGVLARAGLIGAPRAVVREASAEDVLREVPLRSEPARR